MEHTESSIICRKLIPLLTPSAVHPNRYDSFNQVTHSVTTSMCVGMYVWGVNQGLIYTAKDLLQLRTMKVHSGPSLSHFWGVEKIWIENTKSSSNTTNQLH